MGGAGFTRARDENAYKMLVGKREGKDHSEETEVDGR
jgi:hypothetical protein